MKKLLFLLLITSCIQGIAQSIPTFPESLKITPEKTNFEKTSTYAEVIQFLTSISALSNQITVTTIGKSTLGKDIPLAILANPKITTAEEARKSGKPVIYIQANIHGGEVEGKEVSMMLMRDILLGKKQYLLNHQIILFMPIYNIDGNDKMAKGLRPSQENSPLETGERENGQGLDLNRDGVKMEAPETHALIENIFTQWDPQMTVDLHTTNGTWHGYSLTWAPGYLYAGQPETYLYTNNKMLPHITKQLKIKDDINIGPFGDFYPKENWPLKNFYTYNHHPRYIVNQMGLRNRMSILSESFAHERFYQRINSTYQFVDEILSYCNDHAAEIVETNKQAENAAINYVLNNAGKTKKGIRYKMVPTETPLMHFRTYDYTQFVQPDGSVNLVKTGRIVYHDSVNYFGAFKDTLQSTLPRGYIIPAAFSSIATLLKNQGAVVHELTQKTIIKGEVFTVEQLTKATRKFEGHLMASAEGHYAPILYTAQKGDFIVDLAQPLANLIFYLLEPQSDDGLLRWNFYDTYLETEKINEHAVQFPIIKYFTINTKNKH